MTDYRRNRIAGGTYFFTVNLYDRHSRLLVDKIEILRDAVRNVKARRPFHIDAWVVLPEHMHCLWTLPEGDDDFSARWQAIKTGFSRQIPPGERRSASRLERAERGIWQRRFWEHTIRDERDYAAHMDYIHFNPVKHGWTGNVSDWPYSSFHRCVALGFYPLNWARGESYDSDSLGNIVYKSDIVPNSTTSSCPTSGNGFYSYPAAGSARPHAVSSIGGLGSFTYDADGNMLTGNGRTVTYTSFDMVRSVTENGETVTYSYNPEHERIAQTKVGPLSSVDTVYRPDYDITSSPSATTMNERDYVMDPAGERVGDIYRTGITATSNGNMPVYSFYLNDWQNSVSGIANGSTGALQEVDCYDAWGKRRNCAVWDDTTNTLNSTIVRGYTNQEHVYEVGLIDLNARMYDPFLGKMLSVDPAVTNWLDPQAWNAYAYARNNPLVYTDPNGKCPECVVGAILGGGLEIADQMVTSGGRVTDWGAVGRETIIGGIAGATGVGSGELVGLAGKLIYVDGSEAVISAAGTAIRSSVSGATAGATSGALDVAAKGGSSSKILSGAEDGAEKGAGAGLLAAGAGKAVQSLAAKVEDITTNSKMWSQMSLQEKLTVGGSLKQVYGPPPGAAAGSAASHATDVLTSSADKFKAPQPPTCHQSGGVQSCQ